MNAFEQLGREAKAAKIARAIWREIPREQRTDRSLASAIADTPLDDRDSWAVHAGVKKPSADTWSVVVRKIEELVAEERHWLSLDERIA